MRPAHLAIIALLVVALAFMTTAVVRLENYRYANFVGLCAEHDGKGPAARIKREECLNEKETRTSWLWHVLFGLKIL
jgi:hypothetical protein